MIGKKSYKFFFSRFSQVYKKFLVLTRFNPYIYIYIYIERERERVGFICKPRKEYKLVNLIIFVDQNNQGPIWIYRKYGNMKYMESNDYGNMKYGNVSYNFYRIA